MLRASSLVAAGLAAFRLTNAQVAIPAITGAAGGNNGACGGCYVVADVAGIAFGSEISTATATNQIVVIPGMNSTFTTTSVVFDQGQFTFAPVTGIVQQTAAPAQASPLNIGTSTITVNGVTLTSPTAYNVFTAYSVTSYESTNGGCRIVAGPATKLSSAFSVIIPAGVDYASFAGEAERSFVKFVGSPTCSAAGVNLTPTAIIPQSIITISATTTARATLTPQPALGPTSTARSTNGPTGPTSTSQTGTFIGSLPKGSSTVSLPNGAGTVFIPNTNGSSRTINIAGGAGTGSIAIAGADRARQAGSLLAGAAAVLMGFVA